MFRKIREPSPVVAMQTVGTVEDIGAEAAKRIPAGCRYRYAQPIRYTLEDGTEFDTSLRALTKPKLQTQIANHHRYIGNRQIFADQWQDGDATPNWSTSIRFSIG